MKAKSVDAAATRKKFAASLLSAARDGRLEKSLKDFEEASSGGRILVDLRGGICSG